MAVIAVFAGRAAIPPSQRSAPYPDRLSASIAVASWFSVVAASAACAVELGLSGTVPLATGLATMVSVHMVIGIGEALIAAAVISAVLVARPDLVRSCDLPRESIRRAAGRKVSRAFRVWTFVVVGLVMAAALALFVSPFTSGAPDGLQSVAQANGVDVSQTAPLWRLSPLGGYRLPGIESQGLSTALAGIIGTAALFALVIGVGRVLGRKRAASG
jgi:cobalt/nickel transport system permease protein